MTRTSTDGKLASSLAQSEAGFFNSMVLVMDRYDVHRLRMVTRLERLSGAFFTERERKFL